MQLQNQVTAQGLVTGGFSHNERREELQETKVVTINFQNSRKRDKKDTRNSTLRLTAFSKADWQLALKNRQNKGNRYYKGVQQGITTDLQYFKIYGPGVSLFFYFQKYLIFAYMIMSLVALIPTIFNYVSGSYIAGQGSTLAYYFGGTTIGNFSTSSNYSSSYKLINTITDMLIIFVFIVFYFYWLRQGSTLNSSIKNTIKLRSYYVVELMQFSQNVSIEDVKEFMNRFGAVTEVAPVKNYSQMIALSKTIYDLEVELKELQFKKEQNQEGDLEEQIKQTKMKIDQNYQKLMECQDTQNEEYLKFYISFATVQDRQNTLKKLENHQRTICSCFDYTPDQFLLKGQKVTVRACHTEPTDILWQNQNVNWSTRWIRSLIQLILLLAALCLGFLVVSFMNILVPASASSVSTSSYTSTTILAETNTTIIQSWCIKNYISVLESGSSSSIYSFCWSYIYQYLLKILITLGISVVIVIVKFILKKFIMFLSRFKRYKTQSQQAKDMVLNLFLAYLATTVMITLLLQAYIFGISFKNYIQQIISSDYLLQNSKSLKQYQDFVSEWYLQICYQIFFNCLTMALHPALTMPLVLYVKQKFNQWRAKKEEVQANMQKIIEPSQFQIESNYADLLVIIFMGLAFSGGAPIMTIICFITITFRYLYYKYLFFRHCKIPKTFDEALDNVLVTIIPFGIFLHFAFSIWMFGVTNIFSADTALSIDLGTSTFMQSVSFIFQRILGTYYYSTFFIVFVVFWVFKTLIYNLIIKLAIGEQKGTKTNPNQLGSHEISQDFFHNAISSKSLCASYKIESNPDYVQVLEIMKKKRRLILQVKKVTQRDIL